MSVLPLVTGRLPFEGGGPEGSKLAGSCPTEQSTGRTNRG